MGMSLNKIKSSAHSIEVKSAAGQALALDGSGFITANINGSVTVSATALDIRSLTHVSDSVKIGDGVDFLAVAADGSIAVTDNGGSLTVDATALDIRPLTNADVVTIEDGGGSITIDGAVSTTPGGFSSWKVTQASVTSTESELVAIPLTNRTAVLIQNLSSNDIYIDSATGVSVAGGMMIPEESVYEASLDSVSNIFAIAAAGTNDIRIVEYAA